MEFRIVQENKKDYLPLLLLADEQESMIDRYLERGTLFALYDDGLKTVCVVTDEGGGVYEIKNLATDERFQGKGYGTRMIEHVCAVCRPRAATLRVGTGDSPITIPFYERRGFRFSHRLKNFFTDNYDHPIFEDGIQLIDMVVLEKDLREEMNRKEIVRSLWRDMDARRWDNLEGYFAPGAAIYWHNSNEKFTAEEFARVNADYPGRWAIAVEKLAEFGDEVFSVVRVSEGDVSLHATSFFAFDADKIVRLDEYWGDDGPPPQWRIEKKVGRPID